MNAVICKGTSTPTRYKTEDWVSLEIFLSHGSSSKWGKGRGAISWYFQSCNLRKWWSKGIQTLFWNWIEPRALEFNQFSKFSSLKYDLSCKYFVLLWFLRITYLLNLMQLKDIRSLFSCANDTRNSCSVKGLVTIFRVHKLCIQLSTSSWIVWYWPHNNTETMKDYPKYRKNHLF